MSKQYPPTYRADCYVNGKKYTRPEHPPGFEWRQVLQIEKNKHGQRIRPRWRLYSMRVMGRNTVRTQYSAYRYYVNKWIETKPRLHTIFKRILKSITLPTYNYKQDLDEFNDMLKNTYEENQATYMQICNDGLIPDDTEVDLENLHITVVDDTPEQYIIVDGNIEK